LLKLRIVVVVIFIATFARVYIANKIEEEMEDISNAQNNK